MDSKSSPGYQTKVERQLANIKIISRLLAHELHAQSGPRLNLSRDEVLEIMSSIDLFIEEVSRSRRGGASSQLADVEVQSVTARVN